MVNGESFWLRVGSCLAWDSCCHASPTALDSLLDFGLFGVGLVCLCVCVCVCVCVCARTYIQPRHYTLEVSEEGRQWFLVHRCIVDPAKGEGDKVIEGEEHVTALHQVCFCVCVHFPVCVGLSVLLFIVLASAKHARSRRSRL